MHGCHLGEPEADATVLGYYLSIHEDSTAIWDVGYFVFLPLLYDQAVDCFGSGIIESMAD